MNKKASFLLFIGLTFFLSSCFLFQKTPQKRLPTAPEKEDIEKKLPENKSVTHEEDSLRKEKVPVFYDIALFVPLDIDRVVSGNFEVGSAEPLPSSTVDGLSFYEGVLMAVDSLRSENIPVRLHVYDSKSEKTPLPQLFKSGKVDSADLLLGAVRDNAFNKVASFAKQKKINFISATYPNDGGVRDNPYLYIVNSTLHIHAVAMQSFVQKKFGSKKITVVYKNNAQGKKTVGYLNDAYNNLNYFNKKPLNLFEWTGEVETQTQQLVSQLDKGKRNVIVLTTLYPEVSLNIVSALAPYGEDYRISIVGMPTMNGLSALKEKKYAGIDIYYGSVFPYENLAEFPVLKRMMWKYFALYHARPSEDALNGFETMFYFGQLLNKKGPFFREYVNNSNEHLATEFNFQPIYKNGNSPAYFENTRIYFLKERNGKVTPAN